MHNSWGRGLIAFYLSTCIIILPLAKRFAIFRAILVARATRSGRGCLAIEKARFRRAEEGEGRSDEANTAGAILLCCRSGDPFQLSSDYSRRLFFLLLLVARLTPANFQYCPKRCVSRLYFHFPRSSSSSSTDRGIIFNPISAHTCVTCGRSRANVVKKLFVEL